MAAAGPPGFDGYHLGDLGFEPTRQVDRSAPSTQALVVSRSYARSAVTDSEDEIVAGCTDSLRRFGFAVIDSVIPPEAVAGVRDELSTAAERRRQLSHTEQARPGPNGRVGRVNEFVLTPLFAEHVGHPAVGAVVRTMLDSHVRIAMQNTRVIPSDDDTPDGEPGGFGPVANRGPNGREWHTDVSCCRLIPACACGSFGPSFAEMKKLFGGGQWPHDLSLDGSAGAVRQPFPDVPLCIVCIWYMSDITPDSGATWVVPGAHRDLRNPRGPNDGIVVAAPIPGELQVSCPAGSVFMQDSRMWHSTACHNTSGKPRVATVNRWVPWWVHNSFGQTDGHMPNATGYFTRDEWLALPEPVRPLMQHLCVEIEDTLQAALLARGQAAGAQNKWGFDRVGEPGLEHANAHIKVAIAKL
eukprot:SAG22_NODE_100_length_20558_cov_10.189305_17_plen_412_part_00